MPATNCKISSILVCAKLVLACLSASLSFGQSTLELDEFNTAYLQYGETKDTQPDIAREAARRAYELGRELFGVESERSAMLAINYATLIEDETQSQEYLDEAVEVYQRVFGFGSEAIIDPLMRLGRTLNDRERLTLASQYYERALQLSRDHLGEDSSKAGNVELELASLSLRVGDLDQANARLERARSILSGYSDPGSQSGMTRIDLLTGEYFIARELYLEAIGPLLASLEKFVRFPGAAITLRNRISLIRAYENLNEQELATEHCLAIGLTQRIREGENLRPVYTVTSEVLRNIEQSQAIRVEFLVDREGFVREPQIQTDIEDAELHQAVIKAIAQFRFAPRFIDGSFVESPNQYFVF